MDYRSPLQHLLHSLLPTRGRAPTAATVPDFADTQPVDQRAADAQAARRQAALEERWSTGWAESGIELAGGTEIMEYQDDDTAADLMDEYFAQSEQHKRAA
jgi:hypothetical protein